jgi:dephospho-CoA kinase
MDEQGEPLVAAARSTGRPPRAVAIGLTGGIGAGKSTALSMFRDAGALTISADDIVHTLYKRPSVAALLRERFGDAVLDDAGRVARRQLAAAVRGRPAELRWLEHLTHPLVAEEIKGFITEAPVGSVVVCEVPLLFECAYEPLFDLIVTIEASREKRAERSAQRFHPAQFKELESLQATTEERSAGSHLVYTNDSDKEEMRQFVTRAYARARALV